MPYRLSQFTFFAKASVWDSFVEWRSDTSKMPINQLHSPHVFRYEVLPPPCDRHLTAETQKWGEYDTGSWVSLFSLFRSLLTSHDTYRPFHRNFNSFRALYMHRNFVCLAISLFDTTRKALSADSNIKRRFRIIWDKIVYFSLLSGFGVRIPSEKRWYNTLSSRRNMPKKAILCSLHRKNTGNPTEDDTESLCMHLYVGLYKYMQGLSVSPSVFFQRNFTSGHDADPSPSSTGHWFL